MTNEEYETVLGTVQATMENALRQNERLVMVVKFYADQRNWKNRMAHMDQGEKARGLLNEIEGRAA